jgi:hypothetical protein
MERTTATMKKPPRLRHKKSTQKSSSVRLCCLLAPPSSASVSLPVKIQLKLVSRIALRPASTSDRNKLENPTETGDA